MSFTHDAMTTASLQDPAGYGPAQQSSGLANLPVDVLIKILEMLSIEQFGLLNQTCSQIYLSTTNHPLTLLLSKHFPNFRKTDPNQADLEALKEQYFIASNLTKGVYLSETLQGHNKIVSSLALNRQKLISGSYDNTINIWDLNTNTCIATLQEHDGTVLSLAVDGQRLSSGSSDRTIKIWDLNTNRCNSTLEGHTGPVCTLALSGQKLFSGSVDGTIKIWDLNTNTCTATLQGHNTVVSSLALEGQRLFSGSYDNAIKMWDLHTNTCIAVLEGHDGGVRSLVLNGQRLFSGSIDNTIKIWDLNTNTCSATLEGHDGPVFSLAQDGQRLFSASVDGTIKIWDLMTNRCTATLQVQGQNATLWSLAQDRERLFLGSNKGSIEIWDFTASDEAVFSEIADLLKSEDPSIADHAMVRFESMPPRAKNAIYNELYKIISPFANDKAGCAKDAFHHRNGQISTPWQRAQAILNYLPKRP
ncbi:MAG: WD40 repeat domain-containing protein [Verrucomicrobia bacterium]|nr:WD40 repeat domain-containing protein [Verrucomicrobiota bacterium]